MAEVVQETSPHTDAEWCIFFILPNLNPPVPSPFVSDYLCLCSATDPRLGKVADSPADNTARRMLAQYRNWFQKPYSPGCLLVRHDAPGPLIAADALRAFRNVCAISTITHTMALALASKGNGQWRPLYSDFFLFSSFVAGKNGWIQNLDGPVGGMDDDVEHFAGQCSSQIGLPDGFSLDVDPVLLKRLLLAWEENYLNQPAQQPWLRLFRSLEVGFQAGRFPSDGLSSINDIGTRIGLWVSACEVLLRSDTDNIDKRLVQEAIGAVELSNPRLTRKRFNVQHRGHSYKVALPARIYDDMYRARNLFLHGNPVEQLDLRFGRSAKRARLVDLALLVYSLALRAVLNARMAQDEDDESADFFFGLGRLEEGLSNVIRGSLDATHEGPRNEAKI